jgi:DNA repair protein RecO (recombination protein O)
MPTYEVDALILKKRNYQEADRIVTIFGRGTGKETVRAKGVRRSTSKLAGHLETFSRTKLQVAEGKGFDLITQASLQEVFPHVRTDLDRVSEAFYVIELLDKVTPEGFKDSALFDFVIEFLRVLDGAHEKKLSLLRHGFEMKLLSDLGFRPQLATCVECGKKFTHDAFFDSNDGSFTHAEHTLKGTRGFALPLSVLKVLNFMMHNHFDHIARLYVPEDVMKSLDPVLKILIMNVSEKKIFSRKLLR